MNEDRFKLMDVGQYDVNAQKLKDVEQKGVCEGKVGYKDVVNPYCKGTPEWRHSATAYPWYGEGEDPNRKLFLCKNCADEYYDHWQEMWSNVPNGAW